MIEGFLETFVVGRLNEVGEFMDDDVFQKVAWFFRQFRVQPDGASNS